MLYYRGIENKGCTVGWKQFIRIRFGKKIYNEHLTSGNSQKISHFTLNYELLTNVLQYNSIRYIPTNNYHDLSWEALLPTHYAILTVRLINVFFGNDWST